MEGSITTSMKKFDDLSDQFFKANKDFSSPEIKSIHWNIFSSVSASKNTYWDI